MKRPRKEKTYTVIHEADDDSLRPWISFCIVGKNNLKRWIEENGVHQSMDLIAVNDDRHDCNFGSCQIF